MATRLRDLTFAALRDADPIRLFDGTGRAAWQAAGGPLPDRSPRVLEVVLDPTRWDEDGSAVWDQAGAVNPAIRLVEPPAVDTRLADRRRGSRPD